MKSPLLAGLMSVILVAGCKLMPYPEVTQVSPDAVWLDIATLGEYPTSVSDIELQDDESQVTLWRVQGSPTSSLQTHGVELAIGENAARPESLWGDYEVVVPAEGGSFSLDAGRRYRITFQNGRTKKAAVFTLEQATKTSVP